MFATAATLHVGVLHERVEEVSCLYQRQSPVSEGSDAGVHADPNPGYGHVHEVGMLVLLVALVLETFQQLEKDLLGHLTAATFQIGKTGQSEVGVQFVGGRIERTENIAIIFSLIST